MMISCLPAGAQPAAEPSLEALAFMSGCWRGEFANGGVLEEYYTAASADLMLGTSRYLREGRAVQFEFSRITADSSGVSLLPYPAGLASEHAFRLTMIDGASARFEAPEHDFPKRIHYARDNDGWLSARIDDGGDTRVQEWQMAPVRCPVSRDPHN